MVSIVYKGDTVTSSRLGAPPLEPLVRPPMTYSRSRQVTAECVVLGFSMAGAGVQVRVTGQKHQTSSVASWNGSATWRRIARQQFPRQPPVTNILDPAERRRKKIVENNIYVYNINMVISPGPICLFPNFVQHVHIPSKGFQGKKIIMG